MTDKFAWPHESVCLLPITGILGGNLLPFFYAALTHITCALHWAPSFELPDSTHSWFYDAIPADHLYYHQSESDYVIYSCIIF